MKEVMVTMHEIQKRPKGDIAVEVMLLIPEDSPQLFQGPFF